MNGQAQNHIPYVNNSSEHRFPEDAEAALLVLGIFYVIKRAFRHHHVRAS